MLNYSPPVQLHTKAVLVDEAMTIFGTVNMDMRSFYLNLELSLIIYESGVNAVLSEIMDTYVQQSEPLTEATWKARSSLERFLENLLRLAGPVL